MPFCKKFEEFDEEMRLESKSIKLKKHPYSKMIL